MTVVVAVGAASASAIAVWLWVGPSARYERIQAQPELPRASSRDGRGVLGLVAAVVLVVCGGVVGGAAGAMAMLVLALAGSTVAVLVRRGRHRTALRRAGAEVALAADTVAGLLRAGRVPTLALVEAAADAPVLAAAAAELTAGGDPGDVLRRAAVAPGQQALARLADAWSISARTGAPLAGVWGRAAELVAAQQEVARVVDAELASARSSGRLMAALPAVGLLLGGALGGDPLGFLFGHPIGWVCLVGTAVLTCSGLIWLDAIAASAGGR